VPNKRTAPVEPSTSSTTNRSPVVAFRDDVQQQGNTR
jgi:hypothetical protein